MAEQEHIHETPEMLSSALSAFKAMLSEFGQSNPTYQETIKLVQLRADGDAFLIRFVRGKKYNPASALDCFVKYVDMCRRYNLMKSDLSRRDIDPELEAALALGLWQYPGPHVRDLHGRQVIYFFPRNTRPSQFKPEQILPAFYYILDNVCELEHAQRQGICLVSSGVGTTMSNFDRSLAQQVLTSIREAIPLRVGRLLYWKPPTFFNIIFPIVRQFLSSKMAQRVVLVNTESQFAPYIGVESLMKSETATGELVFDYPRWLQQQKRSTAAVVGTVVEEF